MSETTPIEWCDSTWSPWEGCTKVSPGCDNCYAAGMNHWLRKGENWGPGAPRRLYGDEHWDKPVRWQRAAGKFDTLHQRRRRVFPSVCDIFDNDANAVERARFWGLVRLTPSIDWLVLTKRIGNAGCMLPADWGDGYSNVWLGATVVNQAEADRDIPKLLAMPARVRFLSIEPMLGPIDLTDITLRRGTGDEEHFDALHFDGDAEDEPELGTATLDWVICGGESGPKARPMHPDWARSLRDQCAAAGVPFLFKQWGEWMAADNDGEAVSLTFLAAGPTGPDNPQWHRWPCGVESARVGKKAAGRLLDGRTHDGFPEVVRV